jgi:hypothetical protein
MLHTRAECTLFQWIYDTDSLIKPSAFILKRQSKHTQKGAVITKCQPCGQAVFFAELFAKSSVNTSVLLKLPNQQIRLIWPNIPEHAATILNCI